MPKLLERDRTGGLAYPKERKLITFTHQYKGIEKPVSVWLTPNLHGVGNAMIEILDDDDDSDGDSLGEAIGFYQEDTNHRNFYVVMINNTTHSSGISSVPRIVGSTIFQLVSRSLITEWYSSYAPWMSDEAQDLYEHFLGNNKDLNVQGPTQEYPAYIVTKSCIS